MYWMIQSSIPSRIKIFFCSTKGPDELWDPFIPLPGVRRPELEVYYSTSFNVEVKNEWSSTSTPFTHLRGL
jgi:hypothetical protein